MTSYRNGFEGGLADSTTLTTGNSGGTAGPAFTQVVKDTVTPGTLRVRTANPSHGTYSLEMAPGSGQAQYVAWLDTGGTSTKRWAGGCYIQATAAPSAEDYIMQLRSGATANVVVCSLKVTTAGFLRMFNSGGSASVLQTGTAITWALGTKIRVEWDVTVAASPTTTNGVFTASWFLGDSLTASGTITSSTFDLGTAIPTQTRYGRPAAITGTWPAFWDDFTMETAATGFIGPPPSASPSPVLVQANIVKCDLRTSTPGTGGDTISYSAVQTTGPTTAFDEPLDGLFLFTPDSTTALGYDITLTESSGSTAVQSVTIPPLSATGAAGHMRIRQRVSGAFA